MELPGVLDARQCRAIEDYVTQFGEAVGAVAHEIEGDVVLDQEVRRAKQTAIPRTDETAWLYEHLAAAIDRCNQEHFGFDLRDFDEDLAIVSYETGDFYDWHLDIGRGASTRKVSVSVVLSAPDEYEGGGLTFPGHRYDRVEQGTAIVFPSFVLHGVQPVTRGRRRSLVAWVGGTPFR